MPGNKAADGESFGTRRDRVRLGDNIRKARLAKGWTQKQLSAIAHLGVNGAEHAENRGFWPSLITITRLAQALGAKVSDLIGH